MLKNNNRQHSSAFSSKVGRSMLLVFCLSALLPMTILSIFSYNSVNEKLRGQVETSLHQDAKKLGILIHQELVYFRGDFDVIADKIINQTGNNQAKLKGLKSQLAMLLQSNRNLNSINVMRNQSITFSMGDTLSQQFVRNLLIHKQAASEKVSLGTIRNGTHNNIYLAKPFQKNNQTYWLVVTFNARHFISFSSVFDKTTQFCILKTNFSSVYCPEPVFQSVMPILLKQTGQKSNSIFSNKIDNQDYISYFWTLFLKGRFNTDNWLIIVSEQKLPVFESLTSFAKIFTYSTLLALLTAILLGLTQIRRILAPLHQLKSAIEKIKHKKYNTDLSINRDDEFGLVADSFNEMSHQIGRQFHILETLANIDKHILSATDFSGVIKIILTELPKTVCCHDVSVLILDKEDKQAATLYYLDRNQQTVFARLTISLNLYERLRHNQNYLSLQHKVDPKSPQVANNDQQFAFPVMVEQHSVAAILLTLDKTGSLEDETIQNIKQFSDRIAVAVSNYQWREKLYYQAHYDFLTGLPNRLLFLENLASALKQAEANKSQLAVLFLDLDRFKNVNDSLGHDYGDQLLIQASEKLNSVIDEHHFLARLGGDEFILFIEQAAEGEFEAQVANFATQLYRILEKPVLLKNIKMFISMSIGIALFPKNGTSVTELLQKADIAMYEAKNKGKNQYQFFDHSMDKHIATHLFLDNYLHAAMSGNKFELVYQPQYSTHQQKFIGCEVLLRLRDQEGHYIPNHEYIPVAEETGLIVPITEWIMESVFRKISRQQKQYHLAIEYSINLSAVHIRYDSLVPKIISLSEKYGVDPSMIKFELTESSLIQNLDEALAKLNEIHQAGFNIAIDDFGTGYSSISLLTTLPISTMKIDRSFIMDLHHDEKKYTIVKSFIDMAHNLKLNVVAEGVEQSLELECLKSLNCDIIQGFLFSMPLAETDFDHFLESYHLNQKRNTRIG